MSRIHPFATPLLLLLALLPGTRASAQITENGVTRYVTGAQADKSTQALGGTCLMGGATENDEAMRWFLRRAAGGDVVVMRTSGSDGYNDYFFSELGVTINSVETLVFTEDYRGADDHILTAIRQAEAIWFAGGDQLDYINSWRGTIVDSLIREGVLNRDVVIGGTSAGMAIQGGYYFTAENGTIRSADALANPQDDRLTISKKLFLDNPILGDLITDTHFDNPDRRGRLLSFLARIVTDDGVHARAIACDEYTAVTITPLGVTAVYGSDDEDDYAYFLRPPCQPTKPSDQATPGLTWLGDGGGALAYRVKGSSQGTPGLILTSNEAGDAGEWFRWTAERGVFQEVATTAPNCSPSSTIEPAGLHLKLGPNPARDWLHLEADLPFGLRGVFDGGGRAVTLPVQRRILLSHSIDVRGLVPGRYFAQLQSGEVIFVRSFIVQ